MNDDNWLKLHRDLMEKPIWTASTPEQKTILITLLMMANYYENEWEWKGLPFKAKPGQFVTSLQSIARNAGKGISIQNVRTALKRFEKYEFLTDESTKVNRLITIVNWGVYQSKPKKPNIDANRELTDSQQRANRQLTTNKEYKNKESKNNNIYIVEQKQIIDYLNKKTGSNYKTSTSKTKSLITSRLNEKYTVDDFKKVIDIKSEQWLKDSKMKAYLRPETLFGAKFEGYLNEQKEEVNPYAHIETVI